MKHPIIFSYPRSGLHLTAKIIDWDLFVDFKKMDSQVFMMNRVKEKNKEVLFTHKTTKMLSIQTINFFLENCKCIFLVRDPKDAITSWSLLNFPNTFISGVGSDIRPLLSKEDFIKKFINSPFRMKKIFVSDKIELWKDHIRGYKKYNIFTIRYENIINNFEKESKRLSEYLEIPVRSVMPALREVDLSRKGVIRDHINHIDKEMIDEINTRCKSEIDYINNLLY